ncbi:MAG TPA: cytochrome c [Acidimicrobiia bacterium]|nr:cytochrome c [Acidimicrobiia bacterium]
MSRQGFALLLVTVAISCAALWACGGGGGGRASSATPTAGTKGASRETAGARVFRTQCAGCHGTRGQGNLAPSLIGIENRLSVADQTAVVQNGRGLMPAFTTKLTAAEIAAVVDYTRTQLH